MATQNQTMRFQREVARCPACDAALLGEFVVQFASDEVTPLYSDEAQPPDRFEIIGHLAGVKIDAHNCQPPSYVIIDETPMKKHRI